jgi:transglutaminase-like putative cysteine protease
MSQEDIDQFLLPSSGIQSDHPEIIALASDISGRADDQVEKARRLFEFSRDKVRYSVYEPFWEIEHYLALNTLARGRGYCAQKAAVLVALARAAGIPARIAYAHIRNHQLPKDMVRLLGSQVLPYHTYVQWRLNGRWLAATPSFDRKLSEELGWQVVEFQPDQDLMLPAKDLEGRPHITYLEKLGWRPGIMLQEMFDYWLGSAEGSQAKIWMDIVKGGKSFSEVLAEQETS